MYLEDRTVRLQLWDTAGQERFRSLIPSYIRDSAVVVIIYDITSKKSFDSTGDWFTNVGQIIEERRKEDLILVLVGNKTDLGNKREVTVAEGEAMAEKHKAIFVETSAKLGGNVKMLFRKIAQALPGIDAQARRREPQSRFTLGLTI